jgi:hypothetical protein
LKKEKEFQAIGITINKIITENLPKLKKVMPKFGYRKPSRHQTNLTKIEPPNDILSLKQQTQRIQKE